MIDEEIARFLDDLQRWDDVHACMLARSNAHDVLPKTEHFKPGVDTVWKNVTSSINKMFQCIHEMQPLDVTKTTIELDEYYVLHFWLPSKDNMLIAVVSGQTQGLGLIEIEMENIRRKIIKLIGPEEIQQSKEEILV